MNKLVTTKYINNATLTKLAIKTLSNKQMVKNEYADICKQYKSNERWIMMINPEESSLEQLASCNVIDPSRVLKVNSRDSEIKINNIERALLKGNCSALILCDLHLAQSDVKRLQQVALKGSTQCIILNSENRLH